MEVHIVDNIKEINPLHISLSHKMVQKWNWTDKSGKKLNKTQNFAEVYYKKVGNKLRFVLEGVKTRGIIISQAYNKAFMGVKLDDVLSGQIKDKIDSTLSTLIFKDKDLLLSNPEDVTDVNMLKPIFRGIVQRGNLRDDGVTRWDDELVATIPTKNINGELSIDKNICDVEDCNGNTFNWRSVNNGVDIMECVVEIDKIVFQDKITIKSNYRLVVPNDTVVQKITTRRKFNRVQPLGTVNPVEDIKKRSFNDVLDTYQSSTIDSFDDLDDLNNYKRRKGNDGEMQLNVNA